MNISIIAAIGRNCELGYQNDLLWHIPADMKRFKSITSGHTVVMGLRTFESLGSRPLSNRRNIILADQPMQPAPDIVLAGSVADVLEMIDPREEIFIIGGASVYSQFLSLADKIYLTQVHHEYRADTYFPELDMNEWEMTEQTDITGDEKAGVDYSFITLQRKKADFE